MSIAQIVLNQFIRDVTSLPRVVEARRGAPDYAARFGVCSLEEASNMRDDAVVTNVVVELPPLRGGSARQVGRQVRVSKLDRDNGAYRIEIVPGPDPGPASAVSDVSVVGDEVRPMNAAEYDRVREYVASWVAAQLAAWQSLEQNVLALVLLALQWDPKVDDAACRALGGFPARGLDTGPLEFYDDAVSMRLGAPLSERKEVLGPRVRATRLDMSQGKCKLEAIPQAGDSAQPYSAEVSVRGDRLEECGGDLKGVHTYLSGWLIRQFETCSRTSETSAG